MSYEEFIKGNMYRRKSPNLIKLGFDWNNTNSEEEYLKIQSLLITEYYILNGSQLTIMKKFNIPSSRTMDILFSLFEIQARTQTEALRLSIMENRMQLPTVGHFKCGWHKTWNGKNVYLRSSYEKEYARLLDEQQINYEVECMRIKYFDSQQKQYRTAIPDFYIPSQNKIVEIKAKNWYDPINMHDKEKEYGNLGFQYELVLQGKHWKNMEGPRGFEPRT